MENGWTRQNRRNEVAEGKTDPENRKMFQQAGRLGTVGLEMGLCVAIGAFGGNFLDNRLGTGPVLLWVGFALGLGAATKAVYDAVRRVYKVLNDGDSQTPPQS